MRTRFPEDAQRNRLRALMKGDKNGAVMAHLSQAQSVVASRAQLGGLLGESYGGDRQLYAMLGYPKCVTFDRLWGRYKRQGIATRVANAYPDSTWKGQPEILENEDKKVTQFEKDFNELARKRRLFHYFTRVDKLSQVGKYAIMLLGYNDGRSLNLPVNRATELLYIQVYKESDATILNLTTTPNQRGLVYLKCIR